MEPINQVFVAISNGYELLLVSQDITPDNLLPDSKLVFNTKCGVRTLEFIDALSEPFNTYSANGHIYFEMSDKNKDSFKYVKWKESEEMFEILFR